MINFEYQKVLTVKAAIDAILKNPNSSFIAGGTNLVDLMKKGVTTPQRIIDINELPLKTVTSNAEGLQIGALVVNSDLSENEMVNQNYPLLAMALKAGASPQLRNMATVGGNMMQRTRCTYFYDIAMPCNKRQPGSGCGAMDGYNRMHAIFGASDKCIAVHPSDMCVALAALDATITLTSTKGNRKILFTDFHRLPGNNPEKDNNLEKNEIITGITIPKNDFGKNIYYLKLRDRRSYAFALVSVAAAMEIKGKIINKARLAMGGVAHKPWRLTEAEKFLAGKQVSREIFEQAALLSMKAARPYRYNSFKPKLGAAAIVESLMHAASPEI